MLFADPYLFSLKIQFSFRCPAGVSFRSTPQWGQPSVNGDPQILIFFTDGSMSTGGPFCQFWTCEILRGESFKNWDFVGDCLRKGEVISSEGIWLLVSNILHSHLYVCCLVFQLTAMWFVVRLPAFMTIVINPLISIHHVKSISLGLKSC